MLDGLDRLGTSGRPGEESALLNLEQLFDQLFFSFRALMEFKVKVKWLRNKILEDGLSNNLVQSSRLAENCLHFTEVDVDGLVPLVQLLFFDVIKRQDYQELKKLKFEYDGSVFSLVLGENGELRLTHRPASGDEYPNEADDTRAEDIASEVQTALNTLLGLNNIKQLKDHLLNEIKPTVDRATNFAQV